MQQRNKPKEPPKAPEKAPFFLPSVSGESRRFDLALTPDPSEGRAQKKANRLEKNRALQAESEFMRLLRAEDQGGDCAPLSISFLFQLVADVWTIR